QLKREELAAFDDSDGNNTGWPLYCAIAYRAYLILSLNRSVTDRLLKRLETEDVITGTGIRGLKRAPKLLEGELLGLNTRMSAEDLLPKEALRKVDRPSVTFTAKELRDMRFKAIKYVVPGVIVEGLTLLASKPKKGKSWLMMHAAIAVATGGTTLGGIECEEGDVLYCALEDNPRRLQSRATKLLGISKEWPERL